MWTDHLSVRRWLVLVFNYVDRAGTAAPAVTSAAAAEPRLETVAVRSFHNTVYARHLALVRRALLALAAAERAEVPEAFLCRRAAEAATAVVTALDTVLGSASPPGQQQQMQQQQTQLQHTQRQHHLGVSSPPIPTTGHAFTALMMTPRPPSGASTTPPRPRPIHAAQDAAQHHSHPPDATVLGASGSSSAATPSGGGGGGGGGSLHWRDVGTHYIAAVQRHYTRAAPHGPCAAWIAHAERAFAAESERAAAYLTPSAAAEVNRVVLEALVGGEHEEAVIVSGPDGAGALEALL
jgi:hypothetical protein